MAVWLNFSDSDWLRLPNVLGWRWREDWDRLGSWNTTSTFNSTLTSHSTQLTQSWPHHTLVLFKRTVLGYILVIGHLNIHIRSANLGRKYDFALCEYKATAPDSLKNHQENMYAKLEHFHYPLDKRLKLFCILAWLCAISTCYSNRLFVIEQGRDLFWELICTTNYTLEHTNTITARPTLITTTINQDSPA